MKRVITISFISLFTLSFSILILLSVISLPKNTYAQGASNINNINSGEIVNATGRLNNINSVTFKARNIGNLVIELAIFIAVIFIVVNTVRYFVIDSESSKSEAGMMVLYGVIGLFVILSIWGLVAILKGSFVTNDQRPDSSINNLKFRDPSTNSNGNVNTGLYSGTVEDTYTNYCNNPSGCN